MTAEQLDMSLLSFEDHLDFDEGLGPSQSPMNQSGVTDTAYSIVVEFGECRLPGCASETCCHYCMCDRDECNLGLMSSRESIIRGICERAAVEVIAPKHRASTLVFLAYSFAFLSAVFYLCLVFLWRDSQGLLLALLVAVCVVNAVFISGVRTFRIHEGLKAQERLANFLHGQKFQLLDYGIQPRPGYLADYIQFKYLG